MQRWGRTRRLALSSRSRRWMSCVSWYFLLIACCNSDKSCLLNETSSDAHDSSTQNDGCWALTWAASAPPPPAQVARPRDGRTPPDGPDTALRATAHTHKHSTQKNRWNVQLTSARSTQSAWRNISRSRNCTNKLKHSRVRIAKVLHRARDVLAATFPAPIASFEPTWLGETKWSRQSRI